MGDVSDVRHDNDDAIRTFAEMDSRAEMPRAIIKRTIREVAAEHGLGYRDVMAKSRNRNITAARQHAIELVATKYPHLSLPR